MNWEHFERLWEYLRPKRQFRTIQFNHEKRGNLVTTTPTEPARLPVITILAVFFWVSLATAQLPAPLISLGLNENSGLAVTNAGSVVASFNKTEPPAWSTNVPAGGGVSSIDFGSSTGNYYVESSAVISQLANLESFTVTGWVNNRSATIGSGGNRIISWINNGGNGVDIVYASGGTLKVGINQWPDSSTAISSTGMIPTDAAASASNWRFFAVAYNSATSTIQFYFGANSIPATLDQSLAYNRGAVGATIGKLAIGHFNAESLRPSRTDRMFRGLIDQVQIFGTALALAEIQLVQNGGVVATPVFTSITHSEDSLILGGTNGPANGTYEMLRTTNVAAPLSNWPVIGMQTFDANGNFSFTNGVSPGASEAFYRLRLVSSVPVSAPFITTHPQNGTVAVGQTANLSVIATGTAPLWYQWYFNTNTILLGQTNASLSITNAQLTDAGTYAVTVTNLFGSVSSAFATLNVITNSGSQLVGWAAVAGSGLTTTTGGGAATPVLATNLAHLRTLAGDASPRVILLSGTYVTGATPIEIVSHKTLRGLDASAVIQGGININTRSNIIVQNLSIQANGFGGTPADAAAARTSHHLWFDHVTFSDAGDGLLDLTIGSDYVTVSWCKFFYTDPNNTHRLCSLVGNSSNATATDTGKNNVTYHHNWFATLVDQRMPRLLFGKGHFFNNYYNAPGNTYCIGTGSWGTAVIENNYFQQVKSPHQYQDGNPSFIAASGNIYDSCTGNQNIGLGNPLNDGNDPGLWIPSSYYNYTLDATVDVPSLVMLGAGPH